MELLIKLTALCLCAAAVSLLLAKNSGEYAFLIVAAAAFTAATIVCASLKEIAGLCEELLALAGISLPLLIPLFRVMAIAVLESLGTTLCRDAGKSSLAFVLEIASAVCAIFCAEPMLRAVAELLEKWI